MAYFQLIGQNCLGDLWARLIDLQINYPVPYPQQQHQQQLSPFYDLSASPQIKIYLQVDIKNCNNCISSAPSSFFMASGIRLI